MRTLRDFDIIRAFNSCQDKYTIEIMDNGQYAFMYNVTGTPFRIGDMKYILPYARTMIPSVFDKKMGDMIKKFREEEDID